MRRCAVLSLSCLYVVPQHAAGDFGARDAAYTRELGRHIAEVYRRDTVVMHTQLLAHVLLRRLFRATPGLDLFARLRHRGDVAVPMSELAAEISDVRARLLDLERKGEIHLSPMVRDATSEKIVERALAVWGGYHTKVVARMPSVCQSSVTSYCDRCRRQSTQSTGLSPSRTMHASWLHSEWSVPEEKFHSPVRSSPPSAGTPRPWL